MGTLSSTPVTQVQELWKRCCLTQPLSYPNAWRQGVSTEELGANSQTPSCIKCPRTKVVGDLWHTEILYQ
jgi:hypothetical protein